jgi:hypothetical protein
MNIKKEKQRLLEFVKRNADKDGTDLKGALRDTLTDMMSVCEEEGIVFEELVASASEVKQIEEFLERVGDEDFDDEQ